jgi:hypothetical protein
MSTKRIALIDGDELVYKIGHLCQDSYRLLKHPDRGVFQFDSKQDAVEWLGDDKDDKWELETLVVPHAAHTVKYHLDRILHFIKERTKCVDYTIFLTSDDEENFRYKIATILPYKGNRETDHRPYYWTHTREMIMKMYRGKMETNCEADDGMSKAAYALLDNGNLNYCIVSQDKDLVMVPGDHFNVPKNHLFTVTPEEGIKFFYKQLLAGDATDNIYGIYRIGMTTANKMIENLKTTDETILWDFCLKAYECALGDPKKRPKMPNPDMPLVDRVTEIARLLWMQSYDGELWEPPSKEKKDQTVVM